MRTTFFSCLFLTVLISCNNQKETPEGFLKKDENETDIEKSIYYCTKAIEIDTTYLEAYYKRASLYTSLANGIKSMVENGMQERGNDLVYYDLAIKDYNTILMLDPNETDAQAFIGFEYLYKGDTTKGCLELRKAASLGDKDAIAKVKEICK